MPAVKYAKGEAPKDLDGAVGGLVLDRHNDWAKNKIDDMHPLGTGMLGPSNTQEYAKDGKRPDKESNRTGNKSLPVIKPRK